MSKSMAIIAALLVVVGVVAYGSMFTVHQATQALVLQLGSPVRAIREPGLNFKLPFIQNVEFYDRRILDLDPPAQEVLLSDQKRISVDSFARYRIVDALEFKKKAQTDVRFRQIFGGLLNSAVRSEVAKVLLGDMLTAKRAEVMQSITEQVKALAPEYGVEVIDVRIGRTDLPEETSQAVYNRMRSSRVAQAAELRAQGIEQKVRIQAEADRKRTVILAEAEKTAQILRGQGEGKRTTILNDATNRDPDFYIFLRTMEAYGESLDEGASYILKPGKGFLSRFDGPGGK